MGAWLSNSEQQRGLCQCIVAQPGGGLSRRGSHCARSRFRAGIRLRPPRSVLAASFMFCSAVGPVRTSGSLRRSLRAASGSFSIIAAASSLSENAIRRRPPTSTTSTNAAPAAAVCSTYSSTPPPDSAHSSRVSRSARARRKARARYSAATIAMNASKPTATLMRR